MCRGEWILNISRRQLTLSCLYDMLSTCFECADLLRARVGFSTTDPCIYIEVDYNQVLAIALWMFSIVFSLLSFQGVERFLAVRRLVFTTSSSFPCHIPSFHRLVERKVVRTV